MKLFLVALLIFPVFTFANLTDGNEFIVEENISTTTDNNGTNTNNNNDTDEVFNDGAPPEPELDGTGGFNATQQGGLDGAKQGSSAGKAVAALGLAMGAGFTAACFSCSPSPCWSLCALGAMSFADAASGFGASNSGQTTGSYLDTSYGGHNDGTGDGADPIQIQQLEDGITELETAGITVNPNGSVTTPDGNTFSPGDFASAEDMIAKGMSPNAAKKTASQIASIKSSAAKEAGVNLDDLEGGGQDAQLGAVGGAFGGLGGGGAGGAYGGGGGGGGDTIVEEVEYRGGKKGKNQGRLPASKAADLKKDFNGDPIGIGMANIFLIVHKKYVQEDKNKQFFKREY